MSKKLLIELQIDSLLQVKRLYWLQYILHQLTIKIKKIKGLPKEKVVVATTLTRKGSVTNILRRTGFHNPQ